MRFREMLRRPGPWVWACAGDCELGTLMGYHDQNGELVGDRWVWLDGPAMRGWHNIDYADYLRRKRAERNRR